jgi:hypothetical protein
MNLSELASAPSVKFDEVGDRYRGIITSIEKRQSTDIDTGELQTWPDGRPRMVTCVMLEIDGEEKVLYLRGGNFEVASGTGTSGEVALVAAAKAAGVGSIDAGATLEIVHSGLGKKPSPAKNPPKLYSIKYTAPKQSLDIGDVGGGAALFSDDEG